MDIFKHSFADGEVDLDDLNTYREEWLEMSISELHKEIWSVLGQSIFYMQFFHPDTEWGDQEKRVHEFCRQYVSEIKNRYVDTKENRLWCLKFLYRFADEVENQC